MTRKTKIRKNRKKKTMKGGVNLSSLLWRPREASKEPTFKIPKLNLNRRNLDAKTRAVEERGRRQAQAAAEAMERAREAEDRERLRMEKKDEINVIKQQKEEEERRLAKEAAETQAQARANTGKAQKPFLPSQLPPSVNVIGRIGGFNKKIKIIRRKTKRKKTKRRKTKRKTKRKKLTKRR